VGCVEGKGDIYIIWERQMEITGLTSGRWKRGVNHMVRNVTMGKTHV